MWGRNRRSMSLFDSGIRPAIDAYLAAEQAKMRDYGDYWSASSAGYCMRKLIFERLGVPPVIKEDDARKTRVFTSGHIFHEWAQRITKNAGLSIAQELELQDEDLMVRGHIDDLVLIPNPITPELIKEELKDYDVSDIGVEPAGRLILYDYKTQHSRAFDWQKGRPPSYYHKMQAGTYMYMLRTFDYYDTKSGKLTLTKETTPIFKKVGRINLSQLSEARILKISKDDLRMDENQILWTPELEAEVLNYWNTLNKYWAERKLPACSCADHEGGFMSKEKFNPYFFNGVPCSIELYKQFKKETA